MARCKWCEKSGFFLSVDNVGFCQPCASIHRPNLEYQTDRAVKHLSALSNRRTAASRLEAAEGASVACEELLPFDRRAIRLIDIRLEEMIDDLETIREQIVHDAILQHTSEAREKAQDAATDGAKINGYASAIKALLKLSTLTRDASVLEQAALALRAERDRLRFDLTVRKAEAARAKAQTKKAIDLYIQAILDLQHDSTPDHEQLELIYHAEDRIIELGGTPPTHGAGDRPPPLPNP